MEKFEGERFIRTVLINNVQGLIDKGFDYLAFVIIGQGIETLGSFFDDKPFDHYEVGLPKKRFLKGLTLMEYKYQEKGDFLWKNLRCGLAHQLKPKNDITLTSYQSGAIDSVNLYKGDKSGLTYFVVDTLFKDFKIACQKVIDKLEDSSNNEITSVKKKEIHLTVRQTKLEINPDNGMIKEIIE
jgi:hypothetical protein